MARITNKQLDLALKGLAHTLHMEAYTGEPGTYPREAEKQRLTLIVAAQGERWIGRVETCDGQPFMGSSWFNKAELYEVIQAASQTIYNARKLGLLPGPEEQN